MPSPAQFYVRNTLTTVTALAIIRGSRQCYRHHT